MDLDDLGNILLCMIVIFLKYVYISLKLDGHDDYQIS